MSHTKFASSFAPYTPPPDDPSYNAQPSSSRPSAQRAWFPSQHIISYQSGGLPTFNTSQSRQSTVEDAEANSGAAAWETRYGMRVDLLAAFAYILSPLSALLLLILETHNDYVRFHAYQSALLSTPLLLLRMLASLLQLPSVIRTLLTILLICPLALMAWRGYVGAARYGLTKYQLPGIGPLAEQWVAEE